MLRFLEQYRCLNHAQAAFKSIAPWSQGFVCELAIFLETQISAYIRFTQDFIWFDTSRPTQNCQRFADVTVNAFSLMKIILFTIPISLLILPESPLDNKPLFTPMLALLTGVLCVSLGGDSFFRCSRIMTCGRLPDATSNVKYNFSSFSRIYR